MASLVSPLFLRDKAGSSFLPQAASGIPGLMPSFKYVQEFWLIERPRGVCVGDGESESDDTSE